MPEYPDQRGYGFIWKTYNATEYAFHQWSTTIACYRIRDIYIHVKW
jgi:hypothetical protein